MTTQLWVANNTVVNSQVISDLIKAHQPIYDASILNYQNYIGVQLPISSRVFTDATKVNSKLINDFRGEIIDQCVGFMFGKPVNYLLEDTDQNIKYFNNFLRYNSIDDMDLETAKRTATCGTSGRLLYIDPLGKERIMYLPSWECIWVYNESLTEVIYGIRYYYMTEEVNGLIRYTRKVELYDKQMVHFYTNDGGQFVLDSTVTQNPLPHGFEMVPLIEFENNDERQGDFSKVSSLIDAYDRAMSDAQNELEEFRLAYMVYEGCTVDADFMAAARQTGAIAVPTGSNVEYLTKEINDKFLENHKDNLRDNIYRFSKSVDVTNDNFTGSGASGETRKWLMVALEIRAAIKEMKFRKSTDRMFMCLSTLWSKKGIMIDPMNITLQVDRLYPAELKLEAEIQASLKGVISDETRLSLFSPVRDVKAELDRIDKQKKENIATAQAQLGTGTGDRNDNKQGRAGDVVSD